MKRVDRLLEKYEKEKETAITAEEFRQAARNLLEKMDALQDKSQVELWIRQFFVGLPGLAQRRHNTTAPV